MNSRVFAILALIILAATGAWWWLQSSASAPASPTIGAPKSSTLSKSLLKSVAPAKPIPPTPPPTPPPALPPARRFETPVISAVANPAPAFSPPADSPAVSEPRESIATAIPDLIRILEAKDITTMVHRYMPPSEVTNSRSGLTYEQVIAKISSESNLDNKINGMIQALNAAKDLPPVYSADGNRVKYELPAPIEGMKSVDFIRENGLWYLK